MTYTPNFNDPRVRRRVKQALGFTSACLSPVKSRSWHSLEIDKHLGKQNNPLSRYLRARLLICTDPHFCENKSMSYRLNERGVEFLREQLNINNNITQPTIPLSATSQDIGIDWAKNEFEKELATRVFSYKHKSNRNWHPLQRVKREVKAVVFRDAGLKYQYDIQCAAQRLILQYAQQIPEQLHPTETVGPRNNKRARWLQGPMDLWLPCVQEYLANRTQVRNQLATRLEITDEVAKQIITALFAGARIALNTDSSIYQLLDGDIARIHALKQDPFIEPLREEIKTIWEYITPTLPRRTTTRNNKTRLVPISSRDKWNLYFQLEFQVLGAITDYLRSTDNEFFTEHDGWVCSREVDQDSLRVYVRDKTGFDIKLELEIIS